MQRTRLVLAPAISHKHAESCRFIDRGFRFRLQPTPLRSSPFRLTVEMKRKEKEIGLFEKLVRVEWFEHLGCCYDPAYKCIEEHLDWGVERMSTLTFAGLRSFRIYLGHCGCLAERASNTVQVETG